MSENALDWLPVNDPPTITGAEVAYLQEQIVSLSEALNAETWNNELIREELDNVVARITDVQESGWVEMSAVASDAGLQLSTLKRLSEKLRDVTSTNPLLARGHQLRRDYVYARGIDFSLKPVTSETAIRRAMNDPFNHERLFSEEAHDAIMRARFTDGNRFTLVNKDTNQVIQVPMAQIGNAILDPNDASRVWFLERSTRSGDKTVYITDQYAEALKRQRKKWPTVVKAGGIDHKIDQEWVMVHTAYNRPVGATWGVPDALSAYLWVLTYSNYLKDNAALVKALSRIAVKVSAGNRNRAQAAARAVEASKDGGAGRTAVTSDDVRIDAMGNTGSGVNFNNGRPLAAMIATSLGVSIVALLSDPGTGGSYGVAETLDPPTTLLAQTLQASEKDYYKRVLRLFGANEETQVLFPTVDKDPAYRVLQSVFQAVTNGILSRQEARPLVALLLDITGLDPSDLPEPDGFNVWSDPDASTPAAQPTDPNPGQGNSGAAGSVNQGTDNTQLSDGSRV